jgi:adenosylcobinamide-GDP ribazoletransferase
LQFLTIIPVRLKGDVTEAHVARSVGFFPLVGLLQGLVLVAAYLAFGKAFQPGLAVVLVLLVHVLLNGGFHLDGLADTFDALACRGDREKRRSVMKDGSVGAIGVTAILFALALKGVALMNINDVCVLCFALLAMPVLSKWVMILSMKMSGPAREDGLGRIFVQGIRGKDVVGATVFVIILMSIPFVSGVRDPYYLVGAGVSLFMIYVLTVMLVKLFSGRFGGLTGDNFGALGEVSEVLFLLTVAGCQRLYI